MPRISEEDLDRYRSIEAEYHVFDELRPYLRLAVEIKIGIEEAIEKDLNLTASEIGDLAIERVKQAAVEQATNELVIDYEQTHRRELYQRVKEDVEKNDGPGIFEQVRTRLETDPELARELHDSVRKELGAKAMSTVRNQLSQEQQDAIDQVAQRQLELDRLDVELAIEGALDLHRDDINELLMAGDTLDLFYEDRNGEKRKITLRWVKDGHDHEGWVINHDMSGFYRRDGSHFPISQDQFVEVGTLQSDLQEGNKIVTPNLLTVDMPLVLTQGGKKKQPDHCVPYIGSSYYASDRKPVVLKGIDFKTKELEFFNGEN